MRTVWVSFDETGRDCLEAASASGAGVVGVVTLPGPIQPDVSGQCSFDEVAARLGATIVECSDVNDQATIAAIRDLEPDVVFVVGWSQLLRDEVLAVPRVATFGMHPTLLPRHRGRAPIPWAILSGLASTGVTLFEIGDATADSGAIVGQIEVPIDRDETAGTLYAKVAAAHVDLVRRFTPAILDGTAPRLPQADGRSSWWPKRRPADGIIDWHTRAPYLYDWVRAQSRPYPGAFTFDGNRRLVVWRARPLTADGRGVAGAVLELRDDGVVVQCGEGLLLLQEVEQAGRGPFAGAAVGDAIMPGTVLG